MGVASVHPTLCQFMAPKKKNLRTEERVQATLPVHLGYAEGTTRDVSASGVFFETDAVYRVGNDIAFSVDMNTPGGKMILKCSGRIVRLEPHEQRVGVAVTITESRLEAA